MEPDNVSCTISRAVNCGIYAVTSICKTNRHSDSINSINSYRTSRSPLFRQWGYGNASNSVTTINLPISFTSKYSIATAINSSLYASSYDLAVRTLSESDSQFKAYVKNTSSGTTIGFDWVGIGF